MASELPRQTVVVGKIAGVFGVQGWVRVYSYTEPRSNISQFQRWYCQGADGSLAELPLDAFKQQGKGMIAHIRGVDDRDQALAFQQQHIVVAAEELPELEAGDFYWHQLEGLQVIAGDQLLGRVDHLFETGANDVMVVKPCEGSIDQRERLIPYLPERVVTAVSLASDQIRVDWDVDF